MCIMKYSVNILVVRHCILWIRLSLCRGCRDTVVVNCWTFAYTQWLMLLVSMMFVWCEIASMKGTVLGITAVGAGSVEACFATVCQSSWYRILHDISWWCRSTSCWVRKSRKGLHVLVPATRLLLMQTTLLEVILTVTEIVVVNLWCVLIQKKKALGSSYVGVCQGLAVTWRTKVTTFNHRWAIVQRKMESTKLLFLLILHGSVSSVKQQWALTHTLVSRRRICNACCACFWWVFRPSLT